MAQSHNLINENAWHVKAAEYPSGDLFVMYEVRPGIHDTHNIYEVDRTEEHPYIKIASCPDKGMSLLIADLLVVHFNKTRAPKDPEKDLNLNKLIQIARKNSGPIEFNPVEDDESYEESEAKFDEAKKEHDQRVKEIHDKGSQ